MSAGVNIKPSRNSGLSWWYNSTTPCGSKVGLIFIVFDVVSIPFTSGVARGVENELDTLLALKGVLFSTS